LSLTSYSLIRSIGSNLTSEIRHVIVSDLNINEIFIFPNQRTYSKVPNDEKEDLLHIA